MTAKSAAEMRLFVGFVILPFAAALLGYLGFPLFARSLEKQIGGSFSGDAAISFAAATAIVAFVVMIVGALPLVSVMLKRGPISYGQAVMAGVLLGNAPFLIVTTLATIAFVVKGTSPGIHGVAYGVTGVVRTVTTSTLLGAALGSVFWIVALRGREDVVN